LILSFDRITWYSKSILKSQHILWDNTATYHNLVTCSRHHYSSWKCKTMFRKLWWSTIQSWLRSSSRTNSREYCCNCRRSAWEWSQDSLLNTYCQSDMTSRVSEHERKLKYEKFREVWMLSLSESQMSWRSHWQIIHWWTTRECLSILVYVSFCLRYEQKMIYSNWYQKHHRSFPESSRADRLCSREL